MLAADVRVIDAAWAACQPLLPEHLSPPHPLGCHRQRISDRECFIGILFRLITGCSWFVAAQMCGAGETTLRNRRTEWIAAGVFDQLVALAIETYDNEIGLDLEEIAVDGSIHKAPFGGEGTGPSPISRGKCGWKWSIATEANGIPIGWIAAGANHNDSLLLTDTLLDVVERRLFDDVTTIHLDRGYDSKVVRGICAAFGIDNAVIAERKKSVDGKKRKIFEPLGERWSVERTNSWFSNFGQLRRNTDRFIKQRTAQMALAITMIIFVKLFKNER